MPMTGNISIQHAQHDGQRQLAPNEWVRASAVVTVFFVRIGRGKVWDSTQSIVEILMQLTIVFPTHPQNKYINIR